MKNNPLVYIGAFLLFLAVLFVARKVYVQYDHERQQLYAALAGIPQEGSLFNHDLRLLAFSRELRINPPFSLSQANIEVLDRVIDELAIDEADFETLYENEEQRAILREYLYPIDFLKGVTEAERKRRMVIEEPTKKNADSYLQALEVSLSAYTQHISKLSAYVSQSEQFPYGLIDGSIENHSLNSWFRDLLARASDAELWINLQRNCLKDFEAECLSQPNLHLPEDTRKEAVSEFEPIELVFADYFTEHETYRKPTGGNGEPMTEVPLIEYRGYCTMDGEARHVRLWWNRLEDTGLRYARLLYVDEPLFYNHENRPILFSKFMIDHGVPYQHQGVNHYMCNHYGSDTTTVVSDYGVWHYSRHNVAAKDTASELTYLRELETTLRSATSSVSHEAVLSYLTEVTRVLAEEPQALAYEDRIELEALLLGYRDGSMFLEDRIGSLLKLFEFTYANFKRVAVPNPEYIILGFSAMPILLRADDPESIAKYGLPAQKYPLDQGYPNLIKGLDTLRNAPTPITDPIEYLQRNFDVADQLKLQQI